jgi:hypothetical protein
MGLTDLTGSPPMPPTPWTTAAIPDQTGRTVIITSANSGIAMAMAGAVRGRAIGTSSGAPKGGHPGAAKGNRQTHLG